MDFDQVIKTRRSIRKFKKDPVPREIIENIVLDTLRFAPSAKNLQPWKFLVITDDKAKREICAFCRGRTFIADAPYVIVGLANQQECYQVNAGYMQTDIIDLSIAFTILLLAATNQGLGTCWIGAFEGEKLDKYLGVDSPWRVVALTPVGYPDESGTYYPRKAPQDVLEWIE